ncbi:hypothetical protein N7457_006399 [Penicillium paradoxum]|uniref:uncharacterized protein n=1 Tax=Penicillium paradoxum TaxID=176176 RepID=UPI002548906B|nr:uncharacterized protein N7457_006399 [Penicillium paradoxum]KAJ5781239.1 hypothetical protein N7457_006399 [Penicillium paradoxum]
MADIPEILVHIAAPSTAQDDARYRAQVAAILGFQCVSRQPLMQASDPDDHHAHSFSANPGVHLHSSPSAQHEVLPILREASRPVLLDSSSDRNCLETDGPALRPISSHLDSLESLISVIPDSQPEIGELVCASQSRAELSSSSQDPPAKRRRTASISPEGQGSIQESRSTAADQPTAAHSVNPLCQDPRPGFPSNPILIPSSDPESAIDSTTPIQNAINLTSLPLQIHPPKPPISTARFTTHVTPTLSMLTERLKPARTYKPSRQSRPLDPLERGYWLLRFAIEPQDEGTRDSTELPSPGTIDANKPKPKSKDIHVWPASLFHAFWSFLQDFIGKDGRAGWGVWCILEAAPSSQSSSATHVALKVYTWGEVVMHVYLLLFLASERQVRGMGIQWRDAKEEVIIQMP